jgi:hypothetical protein
MSLPIFKGNFVYTKEVANLSKAISINGRDSNEIENYNTEYLNLENVGKYLIFRLDSEYGQDDPTNDHMIMQIVNEAGRGETPNIKAVYRGVGYVIKDYDRLNLRSQYNANRSLRRNRSNPYGGKKTRGNKQRKQKTMKKSKKH